MIIVTAVDMYTATLELYKKFKTGSVTPEEFNIRVNIAQFNLVKNKYLRAVEDNQKRIDDLTDITIFDAVLPNTNPGVAHAEVITMPMTIANVPEYTFLLDVQFQIQFIKNALFGTSLSGWIDAKPSKSDMRPDTTPDPYRKSKDTSPYYRQKRSGVDQRVIKPDLGPNSLSWVVNAQIDYLRYPKDIFLDPLGINHIDCEMSVEIRQEIVQQCLRELLENSGNPRFATNSQREQEILT